MNMLTSLNTQLDAATQALARLEQDKTYGETMLTSQLQNLPASDMQRVQPQAQQAELAQLIAQEADLTSRYTDDYPDVVTVRRKIRELRAEMAQAPSSPAAASPAPNRPEPANIVSLRAQLHAMDQSIAQKKRDQMAIQAQLRQYQDKISSSPAVQAEYKQITRDYQTAQTFYDELLGKMNQSKMATDLERRQQGEQFKLMDEANLPEGPAFPKRSVFLSGGLGAGLLVGLLIVAWIEYRDTAVRSERDIWAFTKLPTLGMISLTSAPEARSWFKSFGHKNKIEPTNKTLMNAGS
jgi:uncharacterized protein involved in exopolysaccharide biosynthesis